MFLLAQFGFIQLLKNYLIQPFFYEHKSRTLYNYK